MTWLRENLTAEGVVTTTDTWLLARLGAGYVTDAATASRTLLLDLATADWSAEACGVFGIDPADLPEVRDCAGVAGETTAFGPPLPVAGLAVDQQAALLAERCFAAGEAKCTYGTGAFLLATTGPAPVRSTAGLSASVAWRLGGAATYCLDGQVYTAGAAVRWLTGLGLLPGAEGLDAAGASVPDSGGAVFVPALAGLGAPHWRPDARGAFLGLGLGVTRAHLARAVIEGIAASVALLAAVGGRRHRRPARPAPRRRRAHPVPAAGPGAGRPAPGAGGGEQVAGRDRAGRGRARPAGHRASAPRWLRPSARLRWNGSPSPRSPLIKRPNDAPFTTRPSRRCSPPGRPRRGDRGRGNTGRPAGRRGGHRGRRGGHGDRPGARRCRTCPACSSTRRTTWAPGPARRTRRSCTPGSTRSPAAWKAGCCAGATRYWASTRSAPGYRSSGPGRCSSPGRAEQHGGTARDRGQGAPQRCHRRPPDRRRRAVPAGTAPRAGRARRAGHPRGEHHLPVDHPAGLRHAGAGRRGPAAAAQPGHRDPGRGRGAPGGHRAPAWCAAAGW